MSEGSNVLIKASAAVHIAHNLSLAQQQVWNYLIKAAESELTTKQEHSIELNQLRTYFGNTKNDEYLVQTLCGLNIRVLYNILGKDKKNKTGFLTLLESVEIENGICTYAFSKKLIELLDNPTFYAKINLLIQKKFDSKYALFLYELCIDYVGINQTPTIDLELFRTYMGIQENEYSEFKAFNSKIIKIALKEINKKSDLLVEVKFVKKDKKVVRIKFLIEKKYQETENRNVIPATFDVVSNEIIKHLNSLSVSEKDIQKIIQTYPQELILEKINLLKSSKTAIKNVSAWLISALKDNYKSVSYNIQKAEIDNKTKQIEMQARKEQEKKIIDRLKREYEALKEQAIFDKFNALPDYIRTPIDTNYEIWLKQKNKESSYFQFVSLQESKRLFLSETFADEKEKNFEEWLKIQGYNVKKVGINYEFI
jgi:plasmid replication initiation protein